MKTARLLACMVIALAGCATSSGVVNVGPDTYMASAHAMHEAGGLSTARKMAIEDAQKFCTKQGRQILVTNIDEQRGFTSGDSSATFMCLAAGDPELLRPKYRSGPAVTLENKQD